MHLGTRLLLAISVLAAPASAHFVWGRLERAPAPVLEIAFAELPDEPTTAVPLARLESTRAWDRERRPIALEPGSGCLRATLGPDVRVAGAAHTWGLVDREGDGTGAFFLEYYVKAAATAEDAAASVELPVEVFARRDGAQVVATVRRGAEPLREAAVEVHLPQGEPLGLVTDAEGVVRFDSKLPGLHGIRARWIEDRSGAVDGKRYGEVRHYSTLTFELDAAKAEAVVAAAPREPAATSKPASADPAAYALLESAHDSRQVMPPDFPGFRAQLVLAEGERTWTGTLVYRRKGETEVRFEGLDEESLGWARPQLLNLVGHRRGGPFAEGDGRYPLQLDADDANPYGRRIRLHDATDSAYRVRDDKVLEVTRTMEGSTFTISVLETMEADAGKYLANHFLVSYRDPESGALQKVEGYRDGYARVDGVWLPTSRIVVLISDPTSPRVRSIRLKKHERLAEEAEAAR